MASPAAQALFNQQTPAEQERIRASWGGADLMDEWYQNASAAGDPNAIRAGGAGQSEDYARFQGPDFERWAPYYDRAASQAAGRPQYKSSRGAPGFYDKPTECPDGQSPAGPDETSPCKDTAALLAAQGQGGAQSTGQAASTATFEDPLQARLLEMYGGGEGTFAGKTGSAAQDLAGGGVWWSGPQVAEPLPAGATPALTDATLNAFTPNAPSTRQAPTSGYGGAGPYGGAMGGQPTAPTPISSALNSRNVGSAQPVPSANPTPAPVAGNVGENPLTAAVNRRYKDPNRWWTGA